MKSTRCSRKNDRSGATARGGSEDADRADSRGDGGTGGDAGRAGRGGEALRGEWASKGSGWPTSSASTPSMRWGSSGARRSGSSSGPRSCRPIRATRSPSRSRRSRRRPPRAAASSLGIGLSHKIVIESMLGLSYEKPARHMSEYLEVLGPLLRGEACSTRASSTASRRSSRCPARARTGARRGARAGHAEAHRPACRRHDHLDDRPEDAGGRT